MRLRDRIPFWVDWHVAMIDRGVPPDLRHLDAPLVMLLASLAGARLAAGRGSTLASLGLRGSLREGLRFGLLAAVPMAVQAAVTASGVHFGRDLLPGVAVMPFVEEVLFRGLLVVVPVAAGGCRFWPAAIGSALLFGSLHVPWNDTLSWGDAPVFAVTAVGGVWFAWLCRCFRWNLWPAVVLHAAMNAAWLVFGIADDAAGGLWPNVGRGCTIALGTVLALRHRRRTTVPR